MSFFVIYNLIDQVPNPPLRCGGLFKLEAVSKTYAINKIAFHRSVRVI